ncbi:Rho termination factor N-terminal domain-containing protein [Thiovibrio sp. JS02]
MNMNEIKAKAKELGIKVGKMKKADLIRAIQTQEGNSPCYQTDQALCNQESCSWRDDCLP